MGVKMRTKFARVSGVSFFFFFLRQVIPRPPVKGAVVRVLVGLFLTVFLLPSTSKGGTTKANVVTKFSSSPHSLLPLVFLLSSASFFESPLLLLLPQLPRAASCTPLPSLRQSVLEVQGSVGESLLQVVCGACLLRFSSSTHLSVRSSTERTS